MSSPALSRGLRKGIRSLLQVAAGGALTALVDLLAHGLSPTAAGAVMVAWTALVAFLHNYLESAGIVPVLLPTPALIPAAKTVDAVVAPVVGAVEAVADTAGNVTGVVTDLTGAVGGAVTGLLKDEKGGVTAGFFFAVAAIILCFGMLAVACGACTNTNNSLGPTRFVSYHDDRGGDDEGSDNGSGYDGGYQDQRRCQHSEGDCRGSFSPGPFDRSPVDASHNQICVMPGSCSSQGNDKPPPKKAALACAVPVPFHCDPHPKGTS